MEVEKREVDLIEDLEILPFFKNFFKTHFYIAVTYSLRPRVEGSEISFPKEYVIVPKKLGLVDKFRYYIRDFKEWLDLRRVLGGVS